MGIITSNVSKISSFEVLKQKPIKFSNYYPHTDVNYSVSKVNTVSRTTKGGRRRRVSVNGFQTGSNKWISFALPVNGKAVQRFMAVQKFHDGKISKRSRLARFSTLHNYESNPASIDTNLPDDLSYENTDFFKGSAADCKFIEKSVLVNQIPSFRQKIKTRGTWTELGITKQGFDIKADPVQYFFSKSLGTQANIRIKNRGSKHPVKRLKSLALLFSELESPFIKSRKLGVKLDIN